MEKKNRARGIHWEAEGEASADVEALGDAAGEITGGGEDDK